VAEPVPQVGCGSEENLSSVFAANEVSTIAQFKKIITRRGTHYAV